MNPSHGLMQSTPVWTRLFQTLVSYRPSETLEGEIPEATRPYRRRMPRGLRQTIHQWRWTRANRKRTPAPLNAYGSPNVGYW